MTEGSIEAYEAFRQEWGRNNRGPDAVSYLERLNAFEARLAKVNALNARPGATWVAGINHLSDYTELELKMLMGYRRSGRHPGQADNSLTSSFLEVKPRLKLAESVDWRNNVSHHRAIAPLDQGACGSCWAVSAVGALEMHAELYGKYSRPLSYEHLVDCVENKRHCGGTGGCSGATAELAFKHVHQYGILAADEYSGYQHGGKSGCHAPGAKFSRAGSITGYERLEPNKVQPLLEAVGTKGPVVISVDATPWTMYRSGVFNSCGVNATVNHAVLVVGYGYDQKTRLKYWTIRNSWSDRWGESGYIRLQRHDADTGEEGHCGIDSKPQEGVACDGDPPTTPVCGMCGCLSDSSFPTGVVVMPKA